MNIVGAPGFRVTAFAVALIAGICASSDAHAGLMLGWKSGVDERHGDAARTAAMTDVGTAGGFGASSSPTSDEPEQFSPSILELFTGRVETAANETTGGASVPPGNAGWSSGVSAATVLSAVSADQLAARTYHHWRERSPRLPDPLCCELLDPPKACA
jgi:hypothetical protein